jgi:hypothetical protein
MLDTYLKRLQCLWEFVGLDVASYCAITKKYNNKSFPNSNESIYSLELDLVIASTQMELLQPMLSSSPFFWELASFGSYSKLWISLAHGE